MQEIEVKAKVKNINQLKIKLESLGCKFSKPLIQKDKIFTHKSRVGHKTKKGDFILRIRNENGHYIFTMKKQIENELDNIEKETAIDSPKELEDIIINLGFFKEVEVNKTRIKCKYKNMEICLDKVNGLGDFIEVEKLIKKGNGLNVQKELFNFLKNLGINQSDQVKIGYDTLISQKKIWQKINQ